MDYEGEEISFTEWPIGMELCDNEGKNYITIESPKDASKIIESLTRYLKTFEETEGEHNEL